MNNMDPNLSQSNDINTTQLSGNQFNTNSGLNSNYHTTQEAYQSNFTQGTRNHNIPGMSQDQVPNTIIIDGTFNANGNFNSHYGQTFND